MERLTKADRATALATAMAHDLNNELTVILTSISSSLLALEPGHPAREPISAVKSAALRCARKSSEMLEFGVRNGIRPARASWAALLEL